MSIVMPIEGVTFTSAPPPTSMAKSGEKVRDLRSCSGIVCPKESSHHPPMAPTVIEHECNFASGGSNVNLGDHTSRGDW